ncbi:hypothetical protein DPMN_091244 [Dreissena polymorpha]|uniref:SARAH domain-containing protein n=1 Tax=Dreissena polymorpha TaxID=45954 RepID=A0A9D4L1Q8_DREPO|nr:hypothetical protein DPMN_091244 [Dreissena polymorpha]
MRSVCQSWVTSCVYCILYVLVIYIQWDAFCVPELGNFLRVLDREEEEYLAQLKYKYKVMRR